MVWFLRWMVWWLLSSSHRSSTFFRYARGKLHMVLSSLFMHFWRRLMQLDCLLMIKHLIIPKLGLLTGCLVSNLYEVPCTRRSTTTLHPALS